MESLKQIYDAQKAKSGAGAFFSKHVLPLVTALAAEINNDPALAVVFEAAAEYSPKANFLTIEAQFFNKADNSAAGKALLKLDRNYPQYADTGHGPDSNYDISTKMGRLIIAEDLVRKAAGNCALSEGLKLAAAKPATLGRK